MNKLNLQLKTSTLEEQIVTACILEASARKPGNVHPKASFVDLKYQDFIDAAIFAGQELHDAIRIGVGQSVLNAVSRTRQNLNTNVNLGIILLVAPLAAIPVETELDIGISISLAAIDIDQTKLIYQAIQNAKPGGMGEVSKGDVAETPQTTIIEAMQLAADRDMIAKQYVNGFAEVLKFGRQQFLKWFERTQAWESAIIGTHLEFMAAYPDSLIARKCGQKLALKSSQMAREVLEFGWPETNISLQKYREFDYWLRADGHQRNPGTTADLIAAVLFAVIRDKLWSPPDSI
jgi:triphosphoribosyl-dephospho-CoA synthase